ncbi:hypothetical protein CGCSCA4_v006972 [Colletotrichum siamense]|uniref:Uncharacterized protein n=1 Tax=Colletotrichum siamense TaxID=690259 RepID=A0A9P5EUT1_COLSI|nr:hypothetical protein CGCSCA4_v006972 [Colletotrichum siamense]KAF4859762.1 hypothetical protein CGCSCA2_v005969 [Colletotrichum siamense]
MARSATPKQRSKSLLPERSQKRSAPARGDWPDPSHYTNKDKFLQEEVRGISNHDKTPEVDIGYEPKFVRHGVSEHVDHDDVGMITSNWVVFKSEVTALALEGLYGCTSVVLVSRRGAWISHIFEEDMSFEPKFRYRVLEEMHEGLPPNHPSHRLFQYGLDDLIRKPRRGNAGVMFGDDEETPQSLGMRAFIVTPRPRPQRELGNGEFLSDDVLMHDTTINRGHIQYQRSVQRLAHNLTQTYGDIPVDVIDYAPAMVPNGLYRKLNDPNRRHHSDSQRVNREVAEYFSKALTGTPRGKLLLQYRPAKTCADLASWRLWVEDQEVGSRTDGWTPAYDQIFQYGGLNQNPVRRQTCPTPFSQNTSMIGARSSTFTFSSPSVRCQPQGTVEVR